ncbi:hypothetical protein [Microbacterium murale]|uniref:Lipoprotein n=1 Tax=Microbacterium murale TaxID=1081040 RepID=A0ABQ1RSH9_9MICO|nr:hypothetical protein [Microbacterium murale]GGD76682.1 hypothetical protein GCM10007269_19550 [Microbacterium murale]
MYFKSSALGAVALIGALIFTGCAAEPTSAAPEATTTPAAETEAPAPEVAAGDVLTPEQVEELKKAGEIIAGYPVGDQLIAVKWGEPFPDAVRQASNASVNAAVGPEHGHGVSDDQTEQQFRLVDVLSAEAEKLGGISLAAVQCAMSFSTTTNSFQPTWAVSEPDPAGAYSSYQEAIDTVEAWQGGTQTGKRMYVVVNNLGCAQ